MTKALTLALQCKLGSILTHVEEGESPGGHYFDWTAVAALMKDPEVVAWLARMRADGFLPVKRK